MLYVSLPTWDFDLCKYSVIYGLYSFLTCYISFQVIVLSAFVWVHSVVTSLPTLTFVNQLVRYSLSHIYKGIRLYSRVTGKVVCEIYRSISAANRPLPEVRVDNGREEMVMPKMMWIGARGQECRPEAVSGASVFGLLGFGRSKNTRISRSTSE